MARHNTFALSGSVGIGARSRESEPVALGDAGLDFVGDYAAADIIPGPGDCRLAGDVARSAGRRPAEDANSRPWTDFWDKGTQPNQMSQDSKRTSSQDYYPPNESGELILRQTDLVPTCAARAPPWGGRVLADGSRR